MTLKRALIVYVSVLLLSLPLTFPARLLNSFFEYPAGVSAPAFSGSLFSARLDWLQIGALRLQDVRVRPSLTGLFSGAPLAVSVAQPVKGSARIGFSETGYAVNKLSAGVRFERLRELLAIPPLGLDAAISLRVAEAELQADHCQQVQGQLRISDFVGEMEGLSELGELTAQLSCEGARYVLTVDPDNRLRLTGKVVFAATGAYQLTMTAEPPPGPLFETFVDFLGKPRDGRRFQLRFRG